MATIRSAGRCRVDGHPTETLVVGDYFEAHAVRQSLRPRMQVTTVIPDDRSYWRVTRVSDLHPTDNYWTVDIESVDGANYFAGAMVMTWDPAGLLYAEDPDEFGITVTTAVS